MVQRWQRSLGQAKPRRETLWPWSVTPRQTLPATILGSLTIPQWPMNLSWSQLLLRWTWAGYTPAWPTTTSLGKKARLTPCSLFTVSASCLKMHWQKYWQYKHYCKRSIFFFNFNLRIAFACLIPDQSILLPLKRNNLVKITKKKKSQSNNLIGFKLANSLLCI